ncbi:MAG: ABC transporter transmembrane domain-containing protein [Pseudomonadota bacterium]|nr:ABC transporter transmembrane domain-containing protein [Pseudomonadota bacterium]
MDKKSTFNLLKRLFHNYVKKHKVKLVFSMICMGIVAATTAINAWMMQPVLDEIFINKNQSLILLIPIAVIVVAIVKGIASYFQSILMSFIGYKLVAEIQDQMFRAIIKCDLSYYNDINSGTLVSRFIADVGALSRGVHNVIINIIKDSLTFIFLIGVMFYHDTKLALISLFVFPVAIFPIRRIGKRLRKISKNTQVGFGLLTSKLSESFSAIKTIKSFNSEDFESKKINKEIINIFGLTFKSTKINSIARPLMEILSGIAIGAIIFIGGNQVILDQTTPGTFFSFLTALLMAYQPIKSLASLNSTLQIAMASAERVFEILDKKSMILEIKNPKDHFLNDKNQKNLKISKLYFKYKDTTKFVLKNINLEVSKGERVALVGYSGSGKTTLMNLLPRFFDPSKGLIEIGGTNIKDLSFNFLRNYFSLVSQDIVLFDETIKYNICYGAVRYNNKDLRQACAKSNSNEFIKKLPNGINQLVGENGTRLSGGQKQRIAIARAFIRNSPFLLLDEATSSLDSKSEKKIQDSLNKLMSNKTALIIAHRLSTVIDADRIIIINNGEIVDMGKHSSLIRNSKIYKNLYELQFKKKNDKTNT